MDSSESISHSEIDPCHSDHGIDDQFSSLSLHQTIEIDSGDRNRAEEEEANHYKFDSEIHNNGSDVENGGAEERENDENGGENREEEERENGEEKRRRDVYPVRAEAEDCSFYLRTGMCKYGMNCKFNHPPPKKIQDTMAKGKDESLNNGGQADGNNSVTRDGGKVKDKDRSLERSGQVNCKYFDRPGGCKFGKACKFNHSRKFSVAPMAELNFMGLPIRMGERECPYYMRNGSCKFGANCRFNHPDPSTVGGSDSTMPGYGNGKAMSPQSAPQSTFAPWPSPAALNETPYVPLMFSPTHGVPSRPEWNAYQAPVYSPERSMNRPPVYVVNGPPFGNNPHTHTHHHHQQQKPFPVDEFPERPGQPECNFFLKTGDCKYRSACKYHHPKNRIVKSTPCALSDLGLPLRPGQGVCSYYSRYGICKYGPSCKYDHPVNYVHSAPPTMPGPDRSGALSEGMTQNEDVTVGSGN